MRLLCHFYPLKLIRQIIILIPRRSLFWLHTTLETLSEILPILLIRILILFFKVKTPKENEDKEVGIIHKLLFGNPLYAVSVHNESAS